MTDNHRNPKIDEYLGKRVSIKFTHGILFGYLEYADGWYFIRKPYYRNFSTGKTSIRGKWAFRKTHVRLSDIRLIDEDAHVLVD